MKLRELFEAADKTAVVAFGRMNPPTIGHEKLVNAIKKVPGDHFLFLSHTQNHKDNPVSFEQKQKFASAFFPGITIGDNSVRTPIDMMKKLEANGYTKIVYVAGSDRVDSFEKLFNQYNGKDYNFDSITVINAGARDPDAEGAEGMSASKMRSAAERDNFEEFAKGVPVVDLADELFQAVKAGMVKPTKVKKMKAEEFVSEKKQPKTKPTQPNPVAKNAMAAVGGGGFGSHKDKKAAMKRGEEKHKKNYDMSVEARYWSPLDRERREQDAMDQERRDFKRREMEWELRNEPPNNIQVAINGKPWKVFAGRGRPDSQEEFNHLRKMKAWAASKSQATGKKWEVYLTGAPASESVKEDTNIPFEQCPSCRGPIVHESMVNEKQDACYHKVKSRYKVWPSAYASGALVQCRKKGASNWGKKS